MIVSKKIQTKSIRLCSVFIKTHLSQQEFFAMKRTCYYIITNYCHSSESTFIKRDIDQRYWQGILSKFQYLVYIHLQPQFVQKRRNNKITLPIIT